MTQRPPLLRRDGLLLCLMPYVSKENLRQALIQLGETPPDKWNRDQLLLRLQEMQPDHEIFQKKNSRSRQSELRAEMGRASKTKADLQNFLSEKMNLTLTYNETMQQLKMKGEEWIGRMVAPEPSEMVGYGKYADKTYQEVLESDPSYVQWVLTTAKEGPTSWRLEKFAMWLREQPLTQEKQPQLDKMTSLGNKPMPSTSRRGRSRNNKTLLTSSSAAASSTTHTPLTRWCHRIWRMWMWRKRGLSKTRRFPAQRWRTTTTSRSSSSRQSCNICVERRDQLKCGRRPRTKSFADVL